MTRHGPRACVRCGWKRTTNSRTPELCTACRGLERVDPGNDHIQWHTAGLIQRGVVLPPEAPKPRLPGQIEGGYSPVTPENDAPQTRP